MNTCRLSGENLTPTAFRSMACAQCLFYIYFVSPPYSNSYVFSFCPSGLLICNPNDQQQVCDCSQYSKIFNIDEFSMNRNGIVKAAIFVYELLGRLKGDRCPRINETRLVLELFYQTEFSSMHRPVDEVSVTPALPNEFPFITRQCCDAAALCCDSVLSKDDPNDVPGTSCAATWDGWQCFRRTAPGPLVAECPNYIFGDKIRNENIEGNMATKICNADGNWFMVDRPTGKAEWTDYSGCVIQRRPLAKLLAGIFSFSLSVLALIPAITIFSLYRSLRSQPMFRIHRQLLLSFLLSALFYLFNCVFFVIDGAPGEMLYLSNHVSCRLLFTIQLRYMRLATSTWMLAEGVYLYRLLVDAFAEPESLSRYFIVCWGFPALTTIIYSICREWFDNEMCWVSPSDLFWIQWIIMGPCLFALCGNLFLMCIIMYVLVKKLRYNPHMEPIQYRKAVRAVFMLVPVFGLHFLFTIYRMPSYIHQIINLFLDGIQGFVVSVILCYANGRVHECIRKTTAQRADERCLSKLSLQTKERFHKKRHSENSRSDNNPSLSVAFIEPTPLQ